MFELERGTGMKNLVIVGGGFAGVWAALQASAARRRVNSTRQFRITPISRDPWLTIRPRLYEDSLDDTRVPLAEVFDPEEVEVVEAEVQRIVAGAQIAESPGPPCTHERKRDARPWAAPCSARGA